VVSAPENRARLMIKQIVLENFKSYDGLVRISFHQKFTCVVGPNGAGKSNLVDAVSFVLCFPSTKYQGNNLRDLIHRKETERPEDVKRNASVSLVFEAAPVDGNPPIGTEFKRMVVPDGTEHFMVNGLAVSLEDYKVRLGECQILGQARNIFVFQDDLEAAAQRHGKGLTAFFEQVSGSAEKREEYEKLVAEKAWKEEKMRCLNTVKRNILNEKRRMQCQKSEADKYRKMESARQKNTHTVLSVSFTVHSSLG